jgi:hypothetical protein
MRSVAPAVHMGGAGEGEDSGDVHHHHAGPQSQHDVDEHSSSSTGVPSAI